jgi:UDP-glucose 4-epimerase
VFGFKGALSIPIPESAPLNPNTPYGLTKQVGEFYCKFFTQVHGLDTICLRIFNVYGPRMQNRVLSIFANLLLQGQQPKVSGDGTQSRDFVFIRDVAKAFVKAMEAGKGQAGQSFNVGTGKGTNLNELIEKTNQCLGTNIQGLHQEVATGEIDTIVADTGLAKKALGFEAKTTLDDGLSETIEWVKSKAQK